MQINITGHHIDVTEALRAHISKKMIKIKRHFENVTNIQVTLTVEKKIQRAEATVLVSGAELFAQNETPDMYASIDGLIEKLDRQIIKHKEKVSSHNQKSGGIKNMAVEEEA